MKLPRERVRASLSRVEQKHPPFTWGFGPNQGATKLLEKDFARQGIDFARLRWATEDVAWLHPRYAGKPLPEGQAEYMAIWGIETREADYGAGTYTDEIARNPLAGVEETAALEDYPWPRPEDFDYRHLNESRHQLDPEGERAVRLKGGNPFEIFTWMVGMEEAMMRLLSEPELVEAGLTHICRFFKEHLRRQVEAFAGEVDLVQIADDLGMQSGLLMSLNTYRSVIKPFHRDLCQHIQKLLPNAVIEYHSDGSVFDALPDLMDAGVQMLEAVQVECSKMEPERLAERFGDRLMFQGGISVQQVLPFKAPDEVRAFCRRLIGTLGRGGGYLAAPSHAIQAGTPAENVVAMLQEILGAERWEAALGEARVKLQTLPAVRRSGARSRD